jgi:hypothetical protein
LVGLNANAKKGLKATASLAVILTSVMLDFAASSLNVGTLPDPTNAIVSTGSRFQMINRAVRMSMNASATTNHAAKIKSVKMQLGNFSASVRVVTNQ